MKVKIAIEKGPRSSGQIMGSDYIVSANFFPSESEKQVMDEHPLLKDMVVLSYYLSDRYVKNEFVGVQNLIVDGFAIAQYQGARMENLYHGASFKWHVRSISLVTQLHSLILEAAKTFADNARIAGKLIGTSEFEY